MINKQKILVLPFFVFMVFLMIPPFQVVAGDIAKKVVATHGAWDVTLNYQNVSNPTCQISANALSPEMKYAGLITIWRDYKTNRNLAESINIEVGVIDVQREAFVTLDKASVHQFGNDNGVLSGITRDQEGMLLFVATKDNFKKLINSSKGAFMAFTKDESGNEIAIGTSLEGIEEACGECGIFDK